MPKKLNPPCLRNIDRFRKTGCPQKGWDGQEGCPAWIERTFPNEDPAKPPTIIKACMDLISFDYRLEMLRLLEGNQQATESFRNGMVENVDGKAYPKMDRATIALVNILEEERQNRLLQAGQGRPHTITES